MKPRFEWRGEIPASKSILNRLLIVQSFFPELAVVGKSFADDVRKMRSGLTQLANGETIDCGAAGTTFRFLALRASCVHGKHVLTGSDRLFKRPQEELSRVLMQLGIRSRFKGHHFEIDGNDWVLPPEGIKIDQSISSQFVSAVILSAWGLEAPLKIHLSDEQRSAGYSKMTIDLARQVGMKIHQRKNEIEIEKGAGVSLDFLEAEPDVSSAFAVAALAAVAGRATFEKWPVKSLQPDIVFIDILKAMDVEVRHESGELVVEGNGKLRGINWDIGNAPDLFPVLSVLCALADRPSKLFGAPHLVHKESSRIEKSAELVSLMGARVEILPDGMVIHPGPRAEIFAPFDPADDHRMAMAAAVAKTAGFTIEILHPEVVKKSFPEFWLIASKGIAGGN